MPQQRRGCPPTKIERIEKAVREHPDKKFTAVDLQTRIRTNEGKSVLSVNEVASLIMRTGMVIRSGTRKLKRAEGGGRLVEYEKVVDY